MKTKIVDFMLISFEKEVAKEGKDPKVKTFYNIAIKNVWGNFKIQLDHDGDTSPSSIEFKSEKKAINWLYKQYNLKPELLEVYQHPTIKRL